MKGKTNTVLFDLDGTVLDTNRLILESFHHAFGNVYGKVPEDDALTCYFGMTLHEAFRRIATREEDIPHLISYFREYNLANHDAYVQPFPGAQEVLAGLKENNYKIGIVTAKLNRTARRGLALFDLEQYVDAFIGADDTHIHKPDPFPVLECLRRMNAQGQESLMVGDSPHDMTAGRLSGCTTVFVNYSVVRVEDQDLESDYRINSLSELKGILGMI